MSAVQLKKLTPRHDVILAFILANPRTKRGQVALIFGVTEAWLSTVINSDIFQARLAERQDQLFCETLVPLKDKIESLAHRSLDKLAGALETMPIAGHFKTAEMALKMAGYGTANNLATQPASLTLQQNNFYPADPALLKAARDRLGANRGVQLNTLVIEGETV
jgi:hypothetical protein